MDTEQLRTALHGATAGLAPRPSLTQEVVTGGKRRVRRRRIVVAVVTAATAVAVVASSVVGLRVATQSVEPATDPRSSAPTRGDLGADSTFVSWASGQWYDRTHHDGKAADKAHVYWAGTLMFGRVAMIIEPLPDGRTRFGVIVDRPVEDPPAGAVELSGVERTPAFRIGPAGRTVVAFEQNDRPLYISPGILREATGRTHRAWRQMSNIDGLAVTDVEPTAEGSDPRLLPAMPRARIDLAKEVVPVPVGSATVAGDKYRADGPDWGASGGTWLAWAGSPPPDGRYAQKAANIFVPAVAGSGMTDPASSFTVKDAASWFGLFGLPGGRTAILSGYRPGYAGTAEAFVVIVNAQDGLERVIRGPSTPSDTRTVVAPLDGEGWVALAKDSTLSYRVGEDRPWQGMRQDALLVPPNATSIQSEKPGAPPETIDVQ